MTDDDERRLADARRAHQGPIALIGLMGAGKTTVGRRLAKLLHAPFFDSDAAIEDAAQMGVKEIFEKLGEPEFRRAERRVIARLMENGRCVIATGGGAFMDPQTRALLKRDALVLWLDADVATLTERATRRMGHRPLLANGDPALIMARLHEQRAPAYAEAHARLTSPPGPHKATVDAALDIIIEKGREAA